MTVLSRRGFVAQTVAAGLAMTAGTGGRRRLHAGQPAARPASQVITGKDDQLLVLESFPAVLETPRHLLGRDPVTPAPLLFVRNNQQLADADTLAPRSLSGWKLEISGLVSQPSTFNASALAQMDLQKQTMVLQCSGNGRSLFSRAAQTKGTQWGQGGMGCVEFEGVALRDLLRTFGTDVLSEARYVTAEGLDDPEGNQQDFEHSLPVDDVLDRSLLAVRMNGQELPAIHGGPLRLITPGVYGTMQIKWLSALRFVDQESRNQNHAVRYRVPNRPIAAGTDFPFNLENSRSNWAMQVKSVVLEPAAGSETRAGRSMIRGVAFNDGAAPIEAVLVSLDQGQTWRRARLDPAVGPYAWTGWSLAARLPAGRQIILSRAVDAWGRSQPLDGSLFWNPSGYEWNGVEPVEITVV
jgi:sulfite oxidase